MNLSGAGKRKCTSGFALVTVLVIMLVAILLGVSASQLSVVDERVSGNYRAATMARFAAEYGAAKRFSDFVGFGDDATFKAKVEGKGVGLPACNDVTYDGSGVSITEGSLTGVSGLEYDYYECQHQAWNSDYDTIESYYSIKVVGAIRDDAQVIATDEIVSLYRHEYGSPVEGMPGILGECVDVSGGGGGQNYVIGSVHANTKGCMGITLSKKADPELSTLTDGFYVPIPTVSDVVDAEGNVVKEGFLTKFKGFYGPADVVSDPASGVYYTFSSDENYAPTYSPGDNPVAADDPVYDNVSSSEGVGYVTCTLDGSTPTVDADGTPFKMYYCPEDDVEAGGVSMTVSPTFRGDLSYITMVSEGSVSFNGSGGLLDSGSGEEVVGMSVIAAGDILFDGSQDTYGLFWADGDVLQNGNFEMNGAIVSSGSVEFNGNIDFDGGNPVGSGLLNIYKKVKLFSWSS